MGNYVEWKGTFKSYKTGENYEQIQYITIWYEKETFVTNFLIFKNHIITK